jgi:hypothetical protein
MFWASLRHNHGLSSVANEAAARHIKILLQTTIATTPNDWSIARFGRLTQLLRNEKHRDGRPMFEVVARDRTAQGTPDPVLSRLDSSDFDELWLFAVDTGNGLTDEDCTAITREGGRGLMVTRDHMDMGSSVCGLSGVGNAHHFHTQNLDPVKSRRTIDDRFSSQISWPNYHSGNNGDYQTIKVQEPVHPVLGDRRSPTGAIRYLPAHPHEGSVTAPAGESARVIATGTSKASGREFNLAVAFESTKAAGRAIAQSTIHHFTDYNWDTRFGCPTFVDEPVGSSMRTEPQALQDTHRYALNVARWLAHAL